MCDYNERCLEFIEDAERAGFDVNDLKMKLEDFKEKAYRGEIKLRLGLLSESNAKL